MGNDLVSIITPSYNTANFIDQTIESVLNQTYKNWEMIIIDDCSSDNTEEIVNRYKDHRIKFYVNEKNCGAALSRNIAISKARGKWIAFLDSDDLWDKDKLSIQISFMEKNNYHFSYTNYREINEKNMISNNEISGPKCISKTLMYCYCWPGCLTVMYDADYVGKIQIRDLKKNNDYAIWLKIIKQCCCYKVDKCLASYRKRTGSISNVSFYKLIGHHYKLFRYGQEMSIVSSFSLTTLNMVCGFIKKIKYK